MRKNELRPRTRSTIATGCFTILCIALAGPIARAEEHGPEGTKDELTPGYKLFDGDIQVPIDFDPEQRMTYYTNLWPGCTGSA